MLAGIAPVAFFLTRPPVNSSGILSDRNWAREVGAMGQVSECTRIALIVEDDAELRALAVALLEETGLRVVEASSAEQALQYLRYNASDVAFLFCDARLTGVVLARTVRLRWPWIRMVLTSAAPLEDGLDPALRQVRFMPKPWRPLEVLMEAEKAAVASSYGTMVSRTDIKEVGTLRA